MTARFSRAWLALLIALAGLSAAATARADGGALYFPATGHSLADDQGFLSFWRARDGERLLGFPLSEPIADEGVTVQYFERGRLEQVVDAATGASQVRTGRVGAEYAEALWKRFAPAPPRGPAAGGRSFEATGHTLREPFLGFWQSAGGEEMLGAPISEPVWELTERGRQQVQYFERGRLDRDPLAAGSADEIRPGSLGRALALLRGVDIAPVDNPGYESYGPAAPLAPDIAPLGGAPARPEPAPAAPQPAPLPQPAAPQPEPSAPRSSGSGGAKLIVVNLSDQWLHAYEDGEEVFSAPVATGRDGMETPTGTYSIYAKLKVQTMDGVTDGKRWVVPNVPNVMYINGGVALHGTYWHNLFGTGARPSHGCVNLPLKSATWLYQWAPVGTTVKVTY